MGQRMFDFGISKSATTSFQSRIAIAALLTSVSVLLGATVVFIAQQWLSERVQVHRHEEAIALVTAAQAQRLSEKGDALWAQDAILSLANLPDVVGAYVEAPGGARIAAFGQVPAPGLKARGMLMSPARIRSGGRPLGRLVVLSKPLSLGTVTVRYLSVACALFFAAAGLAVFVGRWLATRVTEPVRRLSGAMDQVAERGDFSQTVEPMEDDELGALTNTFNSLLRKLHANDQTLRRTMGELVGARDAAEAANVSKSQFLANMSHEIRTPLNGVLAMAQIMALGDLSDTQRERLEVVRQSGEALLTILNDVLDLSKIEAGHMELELTEFDLADLGRYAEAAFGEMARRKGLRLSIDAPLAGGDRRLGDVGRLRQIVSNLLSNALKFTEHGEVRLTLKVEAEQGGDHLHLTVRDTGIGIPDDKMPILFRKFTQVDSSTTRRFGGTGLGLAISRELAQLMGGRMWAESREGQGSTFHLVTPLPRGAAAPSLRAPSALPPVRSAGPGQRAPRVLAAEDNAANQVVLRSVMQAFGAEMTLVADGLQAVEAWRGGVFDLILMDIQMPVMDGVAAARAIREAEAQDAERGRTPIVALSANAMTHQVKAYLDAGMDLHLAKPIELAKLHAVLRAVMEDDGVLHAGAGEAA